MIAAIYVLYIINCMFLILVVLLQAGKGDSMGAVFGGGSNTLLGNRGAATFLSKLTVASAVLFMVLSIILAYHSSSPGSRVGRGRANPEEAPAATAPGMNPGGEEAGSGSGQASTQTGANSSTRTEEHVALPAEATGSAAPDGLNHAEAPAQTEGLTAQAAEGTGGGMPEGTGGQAPAIPEGSGATTP